MADQATAGAEELAVTYITVTGETRKLGAAVKKQLRESQAHANTNPIRLKASAEVELRSTAAARNEFVAELNKRLKDRRILVYLTPVIDERALRDRLTRMPEGTIKVGLDVSAAEFNRFARDLARRLREHNFVVPISPRLENEAAFRRRMDELTRSRSVDVDVNSRGLSGLSDAMSLGGLSKGALQASAAAAGIAAIGGAAGAALGAVGALGIGIAALGPAAAAAGATIAVGLAGVKDAFSALSSAEDSAGTDGAAQAKAVAAAQEQVQTALEGVEDAHRSLTDAQKDARDAAKDVGEAYKDAREELEDYVYTVKDAALSEEEAKQSLIEAREEFAKAPPEDRAKAFLRLQRADLRYQQAVEKNKDVQAEAAEMAAKGVEGSDRVVAAKEREADANQKVTDAQDAVVKANEQVAKAQAAVAEASEKSSSGQDKAAKALAELSPNAREFVLAARDMKSSWDSVVGDPTQDALFADSAAGIRDLAESAMPTLGAGMTGVATSLNGLTKQFAGFWSAPENLAGIQSIFAGTKSFIDGMGPGLQQATTGFLSLGKAFEPVANQVGAQFAGMLGQVGQAFTTAFDNGSLTQLLGTFGGILEGLGQGLNPLIGGLIEMGNIVGPTLGPLFKTLGESIGALAPSLGQIGATFATTLTALMPDLTKFIDALLTGLEPVLPVIGDLLRSVMTALTPLIGPLSEIAQVVGTALAQAITALAPAIGPLAETFASLISAVAPILPVFAELIASIVGALAPALTTIFEALGPVIKQVAEAFLPVIDQLAPVLAEVAGVLGKALADALTALAPMLPPLIQAWSDMVMAILPILPQLAKMISELLPPLVDLFIQLAPVILKISEVLTWLIENVVVPLVIKYLEKFGETVKWALDTAVSVVTKAKDFLGGALEDIGNFFGDMGKRIGEVWDDVVKSVARGVKTIGDLLKKVPDWAPGSGSAHSAGNALVQWADAHMATGGLLHGRGTGTSDSMMIAASTGEYVVNAAATSKTLPILEAINSGWVPSPGYLRQMLPGFAEGGLVPGKAFAQSMDPARYLMGGFSRTAIDCSAMVAATVNDAFGLDPFVERMSTVNEGAWLKKKGALPGLGGPGDIAIAWYDRGGGANGHTAMRLGDGTGVESRSGDGVVIGSAATSVTDGMFDQHMHIPKELLLGGDGGAAGGSGGVSGGRPSKLGAAPGGSGGSSGGSGGSGGSSGSGGGSSSGATDVRVTNWPSSLGTGLAATGDTSATPTTGTSSTAGTPAAPGVLSTQQYGATPATTATTVAQAEHPLKGLPIPGADVLFNGPAPWYMAQSPEHAMTNLNAQGATLAEKGRKDVEGFFQNNWKEMLETGAGVLGMGAAGAGLAGSADTYNFNGMDPHSAARAVDRVQRRKAMATMRNGGVR